MRPRITVVGSINMDLVFLTQRMPVIGETITGKEFRQVAGGKGANQAVAAARQGGDVAFVGCVGDDGFGAQSLAGLAADGIDVSHISKVANTATGVAGILVDATGHNCIVIAPGANAAVSTDMVDAASALIGDSQYLICQLEIPMPSVERAISLARAKGAKVVFNPAPMLPLQDALVSQIDYLVVNETEAGQMSGIEVRDGASAEKAAAVLRGRGVSTVLLTMGGDGACVADAAGSRFMPALKVDVVDTTAAGDTFVGAFTVGLAHGLPVDAAVMEAQYTAALTVTKLGAQTSIPTRAEVTDFMQSRGFAAGR